MLPFKTSHFKTNTNITIRNVFLIVICMFSSMQMTYAADDIPAKQAAEQMINPGSELWVRKTKEDKVSFSGVVSYDKNEGSNEAMLYPAPGLIGMLAAVATHGVIANSINEDRKQKLRDKANEVLRPYRDVLNALQMSELLQSALSQMTNTANKKLIEQTAVNTPNATIIESAPAFWLTQDQKTLILENVISVKKANAGSAYQLTVKIVSPAKEADDQAKYWIDLQGLKLKSESAAMLAKSFDIALQDNINADIKNHPFKTVRYMEGGSEKVERGQPVTLSCNQMLLKTLRGTYMYVPLKESIEATNSTACANQ